MPTGMAQPARRELLLDCKNPTLPVACGLRVRYGSFLGECENLILYIEHILALQRTRVTPVIFCRIPLQVVDGNIPRGEGKTGEESRRPG